MLQGVIEQRNSRSLAPCHRESVEFDHPVSFLSYLQKPLWRKFLVYFGRHLAERNFSSGTRAWRFGFQKAQRLGHSEPAPTSEP
jgi:hypothetical protein